MEAFPFVIGHSSGLPLDKRYEDMTGSERAAVRNWYTKMGPGDEPPFPAHGLAPIIRALSEGIGKLQVTGDLYLIVDVSSSGEPVSATAYGSPSPEMARFAASVLLLTRFKPALCHWRPCAQKFPFNLHFELE